MYNFKYAYSHNGFARVYYRRPPSKRLFCLQKCVSSFQLYSCSKDGEPQAVCMLVDQTFEPPVGDSSIDREVQDFIASQQSTKETHAENTN